MNVGNILNQEIISNDTLNCYANSMFRYEYLNKVWIEKCKQYLFELFDDIAGKVVVDYAFGRGNWSLAFLAAGAKKVYAIDASIDNCRKLEAYCNENGITNIEIIHGNIVNNSIFLNVDIVWVYGILHHISEIDVFLQNIKALMTANGVLYFYYYNKNSLRNITVQICRELYTFSGEDEFFDYQWLLPRGVKKRASDDLVAPYIDWKTLKELCECLTRNGYSIQRGPDKDFDQYLHGRKNLEFYPHQVLCSLNETVGIDVIEPEMPFIEEILILNRVLRDILFDDTFVADRKHLCIGLYNTHFINIDACNIEKILIENLLFGMRALLQMSGSVIKTLSTETQSYKELVLASMQDVDRQKYKVILGDNLFTKYICENRLRM
jgi:SAM-dependent methyltransferase